MHLLTRSRLHLLGVLAILINATVIRSVTFAQAELPGQGAPENATSLSDGQQRMLQALQQRVAEKPNHSESWRSLGRLQKAIGDSQAAMFSALKAVELDPFNAAAHFDVGQLYVSMQNPTQASVHFNKVFEIAPSSSYASQLTDQGFVSHVTPPTSLGTPVVMKTDAQVGGAASDPFTSPSVLPPPSPDQPIQPVGYQIQSFDGSDDLEQRFDQLESEVQSPANRLRVFLETGVLYNTNVTLTPVSRELAQSDSGSFQWFANPDLDWKLIRTDQTRIGPMFRGYYTANEESYQEFNLASFQPGAFWERDFVVQQHEVIGRIEYVFSTDFFDGDQVGDRHAATASVTVIRPDLDAIYGYLTIAQSDFEDDGIIPSQTSLDGTTITGGLSRFFQTGWKRVPTHSLGVDLESANTDGDDYRYLSANLHGSAGLELGDRWKLIPTWGVGYREYPDFTQSPARDEFFWRLHGRLQYSFTDHWVVALIAGHDRFASDNADFDTERTEGGLVLTFTR